MLDSTIKAELSSVESNIKNYGLAGTQSILTLIQNCLFEIVAKIALVASSSGLGTSSAKVTIGNSVFMFQMNVSTASNIFMLAD